MKELIKNVARWENEHIASFNAKDEGVKNAFRMKKEHTAFVRKNSKELAQSLKLDEHLIDLAELIGLCHDLGRFYQYDKYNTFNDSQSEDHAALALKIFEKCPYKKELSHRDLFLMQFAIFNHNKKEIEEIAGDAEDAIMLAKIIRDADKLDIYRALEPYLTGNDAKGAPNFVNADASMEITPNFMEIFVEGRQADYNEIKTHGDRKLVRLLWIYDVNFSWTMQQIKDAGYADRIIKSLYPKNERLELGVKRLYEHMEKMIAGERA